MDIWNVLGIEPTEDKSVIKKAYLAKLKITHPEEKPEEFAILKEAYDLAQQFKFGEEVVKSDFLKELELLYGNIEKRLNVENWIELLNKYLEKDKVSFDSLVNSNVENIRDELLVFIMEKYNISDEVWKLIESEFNINVNKQELCVKFPPNFIDFVISNIRYGTLFQYEYLKISGNKDYDLFIEKTGNLTSLIKNGALKNQDGLVAVKMILDELDAMEIDYLINELNKAMFIGEQIDTDAKIAKLIEIIDEYKDEILPLKHLGYVYITKEMHEEARKCYRAVLELDENDISSMLWLIKSLVATEEYLEAYTLLKACFKHKDFEEHRDFLYNTSVIVCEKLLDYHIKINEEENYSNISSIKDLGYSYLVLNQFKKAKDVYMKLSPSDRDDRIYSNLLSSLLYEENYEEFLNLLEEYKTNVGEIVSEDIGYCACQYYLLTEDYVGCIEECDKYIGKVKNDINILELKVGALVELKRYDEVIEIANSLLNKSISNFTITLMAAESYMAQKDYHNALDYANTASAFDFYSVATQRIRVECFYRIGQVEIAIQLQQHIVETGLDDELINLYACYAHNEQENYQAALDIIVIEQSRETREKSIDYSLLHADILESLDKIEEAVDVLENQMKIKYNLLTVSNLARQYIIVETPDKALELLKKTFLGKKKLTKENLESINYEDFDKDKEYTLHEFQACICRFAWVLFRAYDEYYEEAIILFEKCKGSQIYVRYANELGYCYNQVGEQEKAIKSHRLYIEKSGESDFSWTYTNMIRTTKESNKPDSELCELYEEAITACPNNQSFYNEYVVLLNKIGLYEKCIEVAEKALNNKEIKYFYDAHNEMWSAFVKLKRQEEFKVFNKRFLERAKNEEIESKSYHLYHIAHTYMEDGDYTQALEILNFTEKYLYQTYGDDYDFSKGGDDYVLANLSKCHRELGNEELANKYLEMNLIAIKDSNKCCLNYHTAFAYAKYGDYEKALKYAFKAEKTKVKGGFCNSEPICRHAYEILGEIYSEMGEYELAIKYFEKFLEFEFQLDILNEVERMKNI